MSARHRWPARRRRDRGAVSQTAAVPLVLGIAMLLACMGSALLCATHASRRKQWTGWTRVRGTALIAFLHVAQPVSRAWGRFQGWRSIRRNRTEFPVTQRLYGNLLQRSALLDGLPDHLKACGWVGVPGDEWSDHDLEIPGPGPYRLS